MKNFILALGLFSAASFAQYGKPNIILMMADDLGWGDTRYNGNKTIITPHLDAMAAAGVNFRRFHSQSAVCSPTRGSVLTGRHPDRYGVTYANIGKMEPSELTLAEVLKTQGYVTGHFGKWHLGTLNHDADFPDDRRGGNRSDAEKNYSPPWENGFDVCFSTEVQVPTWDPMVNQSFPTKYWTGPGQYATDNLEGDDSRVLTDRAIAFIESAARSNKPFLAVIWYHAPHSPYVAGPPYLAMYDGAGLSSEVKHYYGAITAMDEQVGRVRAKAKALGLENTILAFTSDNGPESGTPGSSGGLRGHKRQYYEGGIRVPGLVEWPAVIKQPMVTDYMAMSSDYYPTILDILDLEIVSGQPLPVDGISFLDALLGRATVRPLPLAFSRKGGWEALIRGDKKLIREKSSDAWRLYDLSKDVKEATNLAGKTAHKRTRDSLVKIFKAWDAGLVKEDDYPEEPLQIEAAMLNLPIQAKAAASVSNPDSRRQQLPPTALDGAYTVQGRTLEGLRRPSGGAISRQGGKVYLIRKRNSRGSENLKP